MCAKKSTREEALRLLLPGAPYSAFWAIVEASRQPKLKALPPSIAVWLAAVAHIRHRHTEYDQLLAEGYDRLSARHFTREAINSTLSDWRATRFLEDDDDPAL